MKEKKLDVIEEDKEVKNCFWCRKIISKKAKICPYCRITTLHGFLFLLFLITDIVLISILILT